MKETRQFYHHISTQWLSDDSCPDFLIKSEKLLEKEVARVESFLDPTTLDHINKAFDEEVLEKYQGELLEKETGIQYLLSNHKQVDISRMFKLYRRVNKGLIPIADAFKRQIFTEGNRLLDELEQSFDGKESIKAKEIVGDNIFINNLIQLLDKYTKMLNSCFQND
jgi:cullin 1